MRSKLLASVSALALAATIAACSDAPTSPNPTGKPSLDLIGPPCVVVGQPISNEGLRTLRDAFIEPLQLLVNENRINCGQANQFLQHLENAIFAAEAGRCMQAANSFASAAHFLDKLIEEENLGADVRATTVRSTLHAVAKFIEGTDPTDPTPLCENLTDIV